MSSSTAALISRPITSPLGLFDLSNEPKRSLQTALREIFPEKQEETQLRIVRRIMGEAIANLSDKELEIFITKFQYLIDCWMDEFEKEVFDGFTLKQVIMEG